MSNNKTLLTNRKRGNQFEPSKPSTGKVVSKAPAKVYDASVRITTDTRTKLNALRKVSKHRSVDDLLQEMIEARVKKLKDPDKTKYELLIED